MTERNYIHKFKLPNKLEYDTVFEIQSGGHYACDKSFYENNYYKSGYYLIYAESGMGYFEIPEGKFSVPPHTMFWLDLSRPYKYYSDRNDPWIIHWILFDGGISKFFSNRMQAMEKWEFTLKEQDKLYTIFMKTLEQYLAQPQGELTQIRLHQDLTELLCTILLEAGSLSVAQEAIYPDPIRQIVAYVEQNYFQKITLDDLAQLTYLNKYYMARLFKQHTGLAPCEFINRFRLEYSRQMLLSEDLEIEQVALNLGFHSHSYFTRCFKREYGMTPKEYISRSKLDRKPTE